MKERIKRWATGLLVLIGALVTGSNEFPLGDAKPQPEDDE